VKATKKFSVSSFYFHKLQRNLESQPEQHSHTLDPDCLRVTHFPALALRTYDTSLYEIRASLFRNSSWSIFITSKREREKEERRREKESERRPIKYMDYLNEIFDSYQYNKLNKSININLFKYINLIQYNYWRN